MGSAQVDTLPLDEAPEQAANAAPTLKLEVAERLAAHRRRRATHVAAHQAAVAQRSLEHGLPASRHHRIAAAVADRYAQTPSYRAFLAEEAERAVQQAAAAAEMAARTAEAVATASKELLAELELWDKPQTFSAEHARVQTGRQGQKPQLAPVVTLPVPSEPAPVRQLSAAGLTVRLYEDAGRVPKAGLQATGLQSPGGLAAAAHAPVAQSAIDEDEVRALEEEIAFRQSPSFEDFGMHAEPPVPLPANLLAFPRQLVAARKARPVLAEGPLLAEAAARDAQLRIFEVEAEQISAVPLPVSSAPEWSSIYLDAHVPTMHEDATTTAVLASLLPPQTAPAELRLMAAMVDMGLILLGFVAFAATAIELAGSLPALLPATLAGAGMLTLLGVTYQMLFFTLSDQTPGMRYARIGLCTFTDENPSRTAIRRRILAQAVAVLPLGLGLIWALLDDDRLGWHDRISRMYQRAY